MIAPPSSGEDHYSPYVEYRWLVLTVITHIKAGIGTGTSLIYQIPKQLSHIPALPYFY